MSAVNAGDPGALLSEAGRAANQQIGVKEVACVSTGGNVISPANNRSEARQNAVHAARAQKEKVLVEKFWQTQFRLARESKGEFKDHLLPLARIKKVMKTDEEVKMISAEAPLVFSKACEIFITEVSIRAWLNAEDNKRRTLQRSDIATALTKSDQFDFLIDIVPRDELLYTHTTGNTASPHSYLPSAHLPHFPANLPHHQQQPGSQLDYPPLANQNYFHYAARDTDILLGARQHIFNTAEPDHGRANAEASRRGSTTGGHEGTIAPPTTLGSDMQLRSSFAQTNAYYQQAAAAAVAAAAANLSSGAFTSASGLAADPTYLQQLQHYQQLQMHLQQQHSAANTLPFQPQQPDTLTHSQQPPQAQPGAVEASSHRPHGFGQSYLSVPKSTSPLLTSSSSSSLTAENHSQLH